MNNLEYMTLTRNIEANPNNWVSGTVGTGAMYSGHSDGGPDNAIESDGNDGDGYANTGQTAGSTQRRTFELSNGEVIWDLSGNVWEDLDDLIQGNQMPYFTGYGGGVDFTVREWNTINQMGGLRYEEVKASDPSWGDAENIGIYMIGFYDATEYLLIRGGNWFSSGNAGLYSMIALHEEGGVNDGDASRGFRCTLTP